MTAAVPAPKSTKVCRGCGGDAMVKFQSLYLKICCDCGLEAYWPLTDDQTPILQPSRADRKGTAE